MPYIQVMMNDTPEEILEVLVKALENVIKQVDSLSMRVEGASYKPLWWRGC